MKQKQNNEFIRGIYCCRKFTRTDMQGILRGSGLDAAQARQATAQIIDALTVALVAGESVELRGLGSLEVRERKAYKARNPKTGETVNVKSRRRVIFHPGRELKKELSISKAMPQDQIKDIKEN